MGNGKQITFSSEGLDIHGTLREADHPTDKTVVVFCHGAFETQANWASFAERLNHEDFNTFTFDYAGHGASQGIRNLVNLRVWAYNIRDALNTLQAYGYTVFGLVGWGNGGSAALLAATHDLRLTCAVILSTPIHLQPPLPERAAYGLISIVAKIKKKLFRKPLTLSRLNELKELHILSDEAANQAYFADPEVQKLYKSIPIPDSLDRVWVDVSRAVPKIRIPVLVIHGSEDKIISPDQSQKLYALLSGPKELKIINGCGHAVHLDREKDTVYAMISAWMKSNLKNKF